MLVKTFQFGCQWGGSYTSNGPVTMQRDSHLGAFDSCGDQRHQLGMTAGVSVIRPDVRQNTAALLVLSLSEASPPAHQSDLHSAACRCNHKPTCALRNESFCFETSFESLSLACDAS